MDSKWCALNCANDSESGNGLDLDAGDACAFSVTNVDIV